MFEMLQNRPAIVHFNADPLYFKLELRYFNLELIHFNQWEWQEDGTAGWESKSTTASRTTIDGLTSGKKYNFRVVPIGADPTKVYSAIVTTFIL